MLTEWSLTAVGSESISPSQNEPTLPLLGSTWDVPHTVAAAAVVVGVVAVEEVEAVVHRDAPPETTTGATTEAMTKVMIVTMSATKRENTDLTDADLHLLITAEGTALDPDHAPTHHVTTDQREKSRRRIQC